MYTFFSFRRHLQYALVLNPRRTDFKLYHFSRNCFWQLLLGNQAAILTDGNPTFSIMVSDPVSYTHLDVYKRQPVIYEHAGQLPADRLRQQHRRHR